MLATTKPFEFSLANLSPGNQILREDQPRLQNQHSDFQKNLIIVLKFRAFTWCILPQAETQAPLSLAAHCQICPYKLVLIRSQTTSRKFKWGLWDLNIWFPYLRVKTIKICYPYFLFLFGEFAVCQEC